MICKESVEMEEYKLKTIKEPGLDKVKSVNLDTVWEILRDVLAVVITLIMLFPIFWMIVSSLKTSDELLQAVPTLWPKVFKWNNYSEALRMAPFGRYFVNTIAMTAGIMILQMLLSILAAYGFSKGSFRFKNALFIITLGALMIPIQVTFVPIYVMMAKFNWINTFWALIVPDAVSAYSIFMLRQAFMSVDNSYVEAAKVDGMGRLGVIFRILVPMCNSTVVTMGLLTFINGWNAYFWPKMVTSDPAMRTIAIGVYELKRTFAGLETANTNQIMAGAVLAIVPVIIVFLFAQKYLLTGFSKASMK
jgi:multiple sugar transport system permease protein